VRTAREDLETYEIGGRYDLVACIGVLMCFRPERARALLRAVSDAVRPGGTLVVNVLLEGTTYRAMLDPSAHHLFRPREVEDALPGWAVFESRRDEFPAPGDTTKVFSTVVARRPTAR
jgi:tellurite methyltransferase